MAPTALLIGTLVGAAGSVVQGIAAKQQGNFEADIARQNAQTATERAGAEETRLRRGQSRRIASFQARLGAQGTTFQGSPQSLLNDQILEAEEDAFLVRFGGQAQARNELLRADIAESRGRGGLIAGLTGGGQTLLTGFGAGAFSGGGDSSPDRGFAVPF